MGEGMLQGISEEVLRGIVERLVSEVLREKLLEYVSVNEARLKELSLIERVVRVEEELKALREIEERRFEVMNARFEALQREMNARFEAVDKRFEAMDKRFEALQREMDKRFEALEKRFQFFQWVVYVGFTLILGMLGLILRYVAG